jgi:hypothetical protein
MELNGDAPAHAPEWAGSFGRRAADLTHRVRAWADQGVVDPRVAARFVRVRLDEQARRATTWHASGATRRRHDD